jgi:hypothetical protein
MMMATLLTETIEDLRNTLLERKSRDSRSWGMKHYSKGKTGRSFSKNVSKAFHDEGLRGKPKSKAERIKQAVAVAYAYKQKAMGEAVNIWEEEPVKRIILQYPGAKALRYWRRAETFRHTDPAKAARLRQVADKHERDARDNPVDLKMPSPQNTVISPTLQKEIEAFKRKNRAKRQAYGLTGSTPVDSKKNEG